MLSSLEWSDPPIGPCWSVRLYRPEIHQPFVRVINAYNEAIPGQPNLRQLADAVNAGIRMASSTPFEVITIAVCDGLAMNHPGMKYSLASQELIADSVEVVAQAHAFCRHGHRFGWCIRTAWIGCTGNAPDSKEKLDAELREMRQSETWQAGAAVRALRPGSRSK